MLICHFFKILRKKIVFLIVVTSTVFICSLDGKNREDSQFCENIYAKSKEMYSNAIDKSEREREFDFDYNNLFKCYNLNSTRFFDIPFVSIVRYERTVFQSFAEHVYSNFYGRNLESKNVKCGDVIFVQTENIENFKEQFHPKIQHPYILITHESDLSVGNEQWHLEFLHDPKIIMWYTQNIGGKHPKLKPIPIGVIPPYNEELSTLYKLAKKVIPYNYRSNLLYLNFRPETNKNRSEVYKYFKNSFKNNSKVFIDEVRSDWKAYLLNVVNSQFILSPPGNGLDSHRTWEALALGAVPVVLNNSLLPLYDGLPVMIVNDWTDVTEDSMKEFRQKLQSNFSRDGVAWKPRFWLRHWITEIMNVKRNYIKKHCQ